MGLTRQELQQEVNSHTNTRILPAYKLPQEGNTNTIHHICQYKGISYHIQYITNNVKSFKRTGNRGNFIIYQTLYIGEEHPSG